MADLAEVVAAPTTVHIVRFTLIISLSHEFIRGAKAVERGYAFVTWCEETARGYAQRIRIQKRGARILGDGKQTPCKTHETTKEEIMANVPFSVIGNSVYITVMVNGKAIEMILDTGDAVGPAFTSAAAKQLGLTQGAPIGISGAGGASSAYETSCSIVFDNLSYPAEPGIIDSALGGTSLLGLPFFLAKASTLQFDFTTHQLTMMAGVPVVPPPGGGTPPL